MPTLTKRINELEKQIPVESKQYDAFTSYTFIAKLVGNKCSLTRDEFEQIPFISNAHRFEWALTYGQPKTTIKLFLYEQLDSETVTREIQARLLENTYQGFDLSPLPAQDSMHADDFVSAVADAFKQWKSERWRAHREARHDDWKD